LDNNERSSPCRLQGRSRIAFTRSAIKNIVSPNKAISGGKES
jgi:hypothetical protein